MSLSPFIDRYHSRNLGTLVLMLSLDGFRKLMPYVGLELDAPTALQQASIEATRDVPAAYYDEDAIGWHQWWLEIGEAFRNRTLDSIPQPDHKRVLHWLENGNPGGAHTFPHRMFFEDACRWVARSPEINAFVHGEALDIMQDFATAYKKAIADEAYAEIKEEIAIGPDSYFDTWQKTRFHIYILPGAMISHAFIPFDQMRDTHILKTHVDDYLARGGDPTILERMAMLYAEQKETSEWLTGYVADKDAFRMENMWSDAFLERGAPI